VLPGAHRTIPGHDALVPDDGPDLCFVPVTEVLSKAHHESVVVPRGKAPIDVSHLSEEDAKRRVRDGLSQISNRGLDGNDAAAFAIEVLHRQRFLRTSSPAACIGSRSHVFRTPEITI
jgi:hypothetical protein